MVLCTSMQGTRGHSLVNFQCPSFTDPVCSVCHWLSALPPLLVPFGFFGRHWCLMVLCACSPSLFISTDTNHELLRQLRHLFLATDRGSESIIVAIMSPIVVRCASNCRVGYFLLQVVHPVAEAGQSTPSQTTGRSLQPWSLSLFCRVRSSIHLSRCSPSLFLLFSRKFIRVHKDGCCLVSASLERA